MKVFVICYGSSNIGEDLDHKGIMFGNLVVKLWYEDQWNVTLEGFKIKCKGRCKRSRRKLDELTTLKASLHLKNTLYLV